MAKLTAAIRWLLGHRRLPWALALAAIVLMLPALKAGLLVDDLTQRLAQFRPAELPAHAIDTGLVPNESGKLETVVCNLFAYLREEEADTRARDYGFIPWWAREGLKAALFRPLTAFTHWLDYRLFPNTPPLMHAHNIAWYAAAVFLVATIYRKIAASPPTGGLQGSPAEPSAPRKAPLGVWVTGLAACLWLLDKNTYVPVMYVANRGFIVSLVFGLLCLYAHLRWRTAQSNVWMWLAALCLLLSLLANEGGASTLALLLAYALVLDPGDWRRRFTSLLPYAAVVLGWRAVYAGCGFGVRNFLLYIDPGYEPLSFLKQLASRANGLLGGQLTGLPPEAAIVLNANWQTALAVGFAIFNLLCAIVFLPVLRRDPVTRFWAAVTLLALVPAATVAPLTKNMAFIAVGAFGVIASFLVHFSVPQERAATRGLVRAISWFVAGWLVLAHIPGTLTARIGLALLSPSIPKLAARACAFRHSPELGERDLVVINDPTMTTIMVPFDRAYRGQPLPRTIRTLVPGSTRFEVTRADASTLILKAKEADLFDCPAPGPIHLCYACKAGNDFLVGVRTWKLGERVTHKGFEAEVLDVSPRGAPRSVAFHFERPLESAEMVWAFFDWSRRAHLPFVLPQAGKTIEIAGPSRVRRP